MTNVECSYRPIVLPYGLIRPVDWGGVFDRRAPLEVEIGFGMGEVLMDKARQFPERNFIGIEQHWERIHKTLKAITRAQANDGNMLDNIRILKADAHLVFERLIAPGTIDSIYCLFPCPWPKKGHVKHRLFSRRFLKLMNSRLKKGGLLKIVTDYFPYYEWVLQQARWTGFSVETRKIPPQYDTKFEKKWKEEGQEHFFEIDLGKKRRVHVPLKKDRKVKSYTIGHFNAENLHLEDQTGKESVIFKDVFYDGKRQKTMIHTLVAEEHLTQHFWVTILKKQGRWLIARAEGQNFIPSRGIARALSLVHKAALKT